MLSTDFLAVTYGLGSAIIWGAADFSGGFASRRGNILSIVFFSQLIGLCFLLFLSIFFPEPEIGVRYMACGSLAGVGGVLGIIALYTALADGRMSIVAPLSAIVTALVPICFSFITEGFPKMTQLVGMGVAIASVWILSWQKAESGVSKRELYLSIFAGLGFGLFFICVDQASEGGIIRPLIAAKFTSVFLFTMILIKKRLVPAPKPSQFLYIFLAGMLDSIGNALFALASSLGRLDISAVLSSLYPASTVLLAWLVLKERLHGRQWIGVFTAGSALLLIAF